MLTVKDIPVPPVSVLKADDVFSDGYILFAMTLHPNECNEPELLPGPLLPQEAMAVAGGLKVYFDMHNQFTGQLVKGLKCHAYQCSDKEGHTIYEFDGDMINLFLNKNIIGPGMLAYSTM